MGSAVGSLADTDGVAAGLTSSSIFVFFFLIQFLHLNLFFTSLKFFLLFLL
jgi:hypothetical protein